MTQNYFQNLNYSMANEDTYMEYRLIQKLNSRKILTVGGSGSRALPFLAGNPEELRIVDVSSDQLMLIELKLETIKQLTRSNAISFWTSENSHETEAIFNQLKLDDKFKQFFQFHLKNNPGVPPLYWGKWEKTFITFSKLTKLLFPQKVREGVFTASNPYKFYEDNIKGIRWSLLLKIVGNKAMFNSLLYKGSFIQKNSPLSYFDYYHGAFDRLFNLEIKKSHFLQLCLCGKILHEEGLPIEFSEELFNKIKNSTCSPVYQQGSIFERKEETKYDFISLSDVPSYLSGDIERNYIQMLARNMSSGGMIVNRFYLRETENTDIRGFKDVTKEYQAIISEELVQMYQVQLLQKT